MTNRERFLRLLRGDPVDRAPFFPCFGPWPATLERWRREGLAEDEDWMQVCGFDGCMRHKMPVNGFLCPAIEPRVLEDEGDTQIVVDQFGVKKRERKDRGSMPEFLSFMVDSDGDVRELVDLWLEGGVTCLFPWETQMGLDITQVRRRYPTLQMIGGIDKHQLALGRDAIDRELDKIPFMLESGRYLPAVDHFVPPDVSWDNYRYFCERLRALIERYPPTPSA